MKLQVRLIWILALLWSAHVIAAETYTCTEKWMGRAEAAMRSERPILSQGRCSDVQRLFGDSEFYWVRDHKIFALRVRKERSSPCSGRGIGSIGQMFMLECYLPTWLQTHTNTEHRFYWLLSDDPEHFERIAPQQKAYEAFESRRYLRYAKDSKSVFLGVDQIKGADPASFELIFPFGEDPEWKDIYFAQDAWQLFVDLVAMPKLDIESVRWLDVPCVDSTAGCEVVSLRKIRIGVVGRDMVVLDHAGGHGYFVGVAAHRLECFQTGFRHFCSSGPEVYEIEESVSGPLRWARVEGKQRWPRKSEHSEK
ncbi:DKNYY domain-containing protein [Denitromonas iodatirespirans]|uniref:DKNYY domain-containing protein n=1 Tax=Denitromonas iodatirespirans TaxID=2795389 RepID=A0A944DH24_DENI1|nr:DKNYY domain-containing protein [Denitromonas iodatirespirans]MBT0964168.1 DKNYY domain-containing protein [Denitromonas iodatirespirans]